MQRDCVQLFAVGRGHRSGILFAVPNGEMRDPVTAALLVGFNLEHRRGLPIEDRLMPGGQGVLPGTCDLVLLAPGGRTVLIEVKTEEDVVRELKAGAQSTEQKLFQAGAERLDHIYRLVRNTTEFWDVCAEFGVKLLTSRPMQVVYARPPAPVKAVRAPRKRPVVVAAAAVAAGGGGLTRTPRASPVAGRAEAQAPAQAGSGHRWEPG